MKMACLVRQKSCSWLLRWWN